MSKDGRVTDQLFHRPLPRNNAKYATGKETLITSVLRLMRSLCRTRWTYIYVYNMFCKSDRTTDWNVRRFETRSWKTRTHRLQFEYNVYVIVYVLPNRLRRRSWPYIHIHILETFYSSPLTEVDGARSFWNIIVTFWHPRTIRFFTQHSNTIYIHILYIVSKLVEIADVIKLPRRYYVFSPLASPRACPYKILPYYFVK